MNDSSMLYNEAMEHFNTVENVLPVWTSYGWFLITLSIIAIAGLVYLCILNNYKRKTK